MGWFDDFESQDMKEKKAAFMNVVAVMAADGKVEPNELRFLEMVRRRVGLSKEETNNILANPKSVKFTVPRSHQERRFQLIDMVYMMLVDGNIDPREMKEVVKFATLLGFHPLVVSKLLKIIFDGIEMKDSRAQVHSDLEKAERWAQE